MYDNYVKIKEDKKDSIVIIKSGNFYHAYGEDAIIMYYLFKYKIIDDKVGFPVSILTRVISKLKKLEVNYYIDNNNFGIFDNNKYEEIFKESNLYHELSLDIDNIYNYLMNNIERKYIKRIITKIWEVIDEG